MMWSGLQFCPFCAGDELLRLACLWDFETLEEKWSAENDVNREE